MSLYWYQEEAVSALITYLGHTPRGRPLVVAPTGSGKTHIIAGFCQRILQQKPKAKILVLAHVQEILVQNRDKLVTYLPHVQVGLYSSALQCRTIRQVTVASINSIYRRCNEFQDFDYIIVDEAHRIPATGEGMYRKVLAELPRATLLGLTATPYRMGHGYITDSKLFTSIVYSVDMVRLIKEGYLSNVVAPAVSYEMDTTGISRVGGDFNKQELSARFDNDIITKKILLEIIKYKNERKSWLIFAIDIEHAERINNHLNSLGIISAAVHSQLDIDRSDLIELFRQGHIQALVSVETLTTGFDVPQVDLIGILRATDSPVLHVQIIGRGMRVFPGKKDCLVLDFAGNLKNLGPINDPYIRKKGERRKQDNEESIRAKVCPQCKQTMVFQVKVCECGYDFRTANTKLTISASNSTVIAQTLLERITAKEFVVRNVSYELHKKEGKTSSMRVTYHCGLRSFREWVSIEHQGYPKKRANEWWIYRAKTTPPETVEEALKRKDELKKPLSIFVDERGNYPNITRYKF